MDPDNTLSSRARLLFAAKSLFARQGYEQTSTSAIARSAGTSESQLIRHFSSKAGLLQAIFEESWAPLIATIERVRASEADVRESLIEIVSLMIDAFAKDRDVGFLILFEGRRMRGATHEVVLSEGYRQFKQLLESLIERGARDGTFPRDINCSAAVAALVGCAEGMTRELILADRAGKPGNFAGLEIREVFRAILEGLSRRTAKSS